MKTFEQFGRFKEDKRFIVLDFLTEILNSVKKYLPEDLKYIKIFNQQVGFQQGQLNLTFYDERWRNIDRKINKDFTEEEQDLYGESCLGDYIHNTLIGNSFNKLVDWRNCDEFHDKVHLDDIVYYEYPG